MVSGTTLILLVLVALILAMACDVSYRRVSRPSAECASVSPDPPFEAQPTLEAEAPADDEVIPADRFAGCIPRFVFTTRYGVLGYHRDHPAFPEDVNLCATAR